MQTVTMDEAKVNLSELIEAAKGGEPFGIIEDGKVTLQVSVARVGSSPQLKPLRRIGFMEGEIKVPDDFDTMGREEINKMFGIEE